MVRALVRTLTLNPSIDLSSDVDEVEPTHKLRTRNDRMDPGGGGINVARVLHRFGVGVDAIFLAGGLSGGLLDELLADRGIDRSRIEIPDDTRISHTIHECSTGREFRFVPEGPCVAPDLIDAAIDAACKPCDIIVASGSLPAGAADDTYARLATRLAGTATRFMLDTSGPELAQALAGGNIFLAKPSRSELEELAGFDLGSEDALAAAARRLVDAGNAAQVAVTLGRQGALLVNADGAWKLPAVEVATRSAVGAGDSFVAGMTYVFATGGSPLDALRLGTAAGAAAAMTPGTDLCFPDDVRRLLAQVGDPERIA